MKPAEYFAQLRAILAKPGQGAEWVAFSSWWATQKAHQRRAWYYMAGITNDAVPPRAWGDMPRQYRAAVVVVVENVRRDLLGIGSAAEASAPAAADLLRRVAA